MSAWKKTPFESLLVDSKDGEWGESEAAVGLREALIVRGTDFPHLGEPNADFPKRWIRNNIIDRKQLQPGDIILETAGGTSSQSTGRSALLKRSFFDHHSEVPVLCASFSRHLRLDTNKYSPGFIFYLLQTLYRTGYMAVFNIQHTGVSRFQYTSFKTHTELRIPELPIQKKIAAILSSYDELIENNNRRIALLEKVAEEIYREWFVRFRFPGHEKVKLVKGVPEGWERKHLPDLANITYGFPFDGARFNTAGRGKPIIRIRNIPDSATSDYTDEIADDRYIVSHGDLLVGMDGEFHINHWQGDAAYLVQRVCRIKARNPLLDGYLAYAIRAPIKHFESILMGATVGHLGATHLKSIELLVPPEHLQPRLHILNDIHRQKLFLAVGARTLSRTRDQLLPRLISGKLSVENLDIQFPPSMMEKVKTEPTATLHA